MNSKSDMRFAGFIALGKILAMLLSFSVPLFLTRFLTKDDYGIYSQYYTLTAFLSVVFSMGISSSLFYFYPTSDEQDQRKLTGNVFLILGILGIIGCLLIFVPYFAEFLLGKEEIIKYSTLIAISVLFAVPSSMINALYVVRKDSLTTVIYPSLEILTKVCIVIITALLTKSLESILLGLVILQLSIFLYVLFYSFVTRKLEFTFSVDFPLLKKQWVYSFPFGLAIILNTLTRRFDKIICISFLTVTDYAIYAVAFFGIPGIQEVYDSLSQVNVMHMSKEYQNGNEEEVLQSYRRFVVKTLSFSVPIILIVYLFSEEIIAFLFTKTYAGAVPFFRIYILSFVIGMFGAGTILRASGKTKLSFRAYLLSAIVSLPLTYFLIRYYGLWGAISASMIAITLPKIVQSYYEIRLLNCALKDYFPWKKIGVILLISIVTIVPVVLLYQLFDFGIVSCMLSTLMYLIVSFGTMIMVDVFIVDKQYVRSIISNILVRNG